MSEERLYWVEITVKFVIASEADNEAELLATRAAEDELSSSGLDGKDMRVRVSRIDTVEGLRRAGCAWSLHSQAFGQKGDKTLADYLEVHDG